MTGWRLIVSPALSGTENMAIDEAIAIAVREEKVPPTVRFYRWRPPTLSIGAFQSVEREVDVDRCRSLGVGLVEAHRRRAVLHDDEVTYSFIVNESHPNSAGRESHTRLPRLLLSTVSCLWGAADVLETMGSPTASSAWHRTRPACFDSSSWYEITVHDKKLVGSPVEEKERCFSTDRSC